jgi:hypothetical protein
VVRSGSESCRESALGVQKCRVDRAMCRGVGLRNNEKRFKLQFCTETINFHHVHYGGECTISFKSGLWEEDGVDVEVEDSTHRSPILQR